MMHGYNIEIGGAYLLHFRKFIEDDAYHNEAMEILRKTGWGTLLNSIQTQWYISQKRTGIGHARFV